MEEQVEQKVPSLSFICPFSSVSSCLSFCHHEYKVSYAENRETELENLEIHSNTAILIQYPFWFWTIWTTLLVSVEKTKGGSVQIRHTVWSHWLSLYCILLLSQGSRKSPACSFPCLVNWLLKLIISDRQKWFGSVPSVVGNLNLIYCIISIFHCKI